MQFAKLFFLLIFSQVTDELNTYDMDGGFGRFEPFGWWWPRPSGGEDADDVFRVSWVLNYYQILASKHTRMPIPTYNKTVSN